MSTHLHVGGLPGGIDEDTFTALFADYGTIVHSKCYPEKTCGFVSFSTPAEASNVIATLDGAEFGGSLLKVDYQHKGGAKGGSKGDYGYAKGGSSWQRSDPYGGNQKGDAAKGGAFAGDLTKTKMCKFFDKDGFCPNEATCRYAHGAHELQSPSAGGAPSEAPKGGKGGNLVKTKLCDFFTESGRCSNGDSCRFAHGSHELGAPGPGSRGDAWAAAAPTWSASPKAADGAWCSSQEGILVGKRVDYTIGQAASHIYIQGLPPDADELYLYKIFAPLGCIISTFVKDTQKGRIGFVTFCRAAEAEHAISQVNGAPTAQGTQLMVSLQRKDRNKGKGDIKGK
jgi:hypothetical protein